MSSTVISPRPIDRIRMICLMLAGSVGFPSMPDKRANEKPDGELESSMKIATFRTDNISDNRRTRESSNCGKAVVCARVLPKS